MTITLELPEAAVLALARLDGYRETVNKRDDDGARFQEPNPETKEAFVERKIRERFNKLVRQGIEVQEKQAFNEKVAGQFEAARIT